jgi:hypothetical protein
MSTGGWLLIRACDVCHYSDIGGDSSSTLPSAEQLLSAVLAWLREGRQWLLHLSVSGW